ncbi:MAG: PaaI family thioesterase [Lachnospiraceae bacterium]|nr:PaaI family thioesterase [Lachnospiraceae bacterium]
MSDMLKRVQEGINNQSLARMLGFKAEKAEEGVAVISIEKRDDLLQQTGTLHGGVIGALMEAAGGYAALTVLPEGQSLIGVEYKVNFLRAITADKAYAKATVLKRGRQLIVLDVEAYNEGSDKIAAKMIMTGTPTGGSK